ncbi:hypothetical protein SALBM135S_06349 [Streptomyces alboniger]
MPDRPHHLAEGPRVGIRHFRLADAAEFTARARESRELHRPWLFPPTADDTYRAYASPLIEDPAREGFLLCERDSGAIAGFININNIVRGGFRCGALGYGAFAHAAGRGLMGEGLGLVLAYAFGELRAAPPGGQHPAGQRRLDRPRAPPRLPPRGLLAGLPVHRRGLARPRALGGHGGPGLSGPAGLRANPVRTPSVRGRGIRVPW